LIRTTPRTHVHYHDESWDDICKSALLVELMLEDGRGAL
jgi:hypothetical protein